MALIFYHSPLSPYSQRVRLFLEEAKIPFVSQELNVFSGATRVGSYFAVNFFGQVPAIELGGFKLGESHAILRYLATRFGLASFYPENLEDRARLDEVMEFSAQHVGRYLMTMSWHQTLLERLGGRPNPQAVSDARAQLEKSLPRLNLYLEGRVFLAGVNFTIADCSLIPLLHLHRATDLTFDNYSHIKSYIERMRTRPSFAAVLNDYQRAKGIR